MRQINKIIVHCSATTSEQNVGADIIRLWHKNKGWSDIGYHFVIRRSGEIESGRPLERIGAHAKGFNNDSIGICLEGGISKKGKPENNFTETQFNSLRALIDNFTAQFKSASVKGHRDYSPDKNKDGKITKNEWVKVCPCFDVQGWYYGTGSIEEEDKARKPEMEEQKKDGVGKLPDTVGSNTNGNSKTSKPSRKCKPRKSNSSSTVS